MPLESYVKNIIIVGASGQLGSQLVDNLLQKSRFNIAALSRWDSDATFPSRVQVLKGDYNSSEFLESALQGQDVLIVAFGFDVPLNLEAQIIDAAGRAEVPWIIPNEWSGDGMNEKLCEVFSLLGDKRKYRKQIEGLEKCAWIGIATNPWFDYSLKSGWFGIDIPKRKAMIFDDGTNLITTTTISQVSRAVAALLSLPIHSSTGSPCLSDYKNRFVYLESFSISQQDMLAAVQQATGTCPGDWSIEEKSSEDYIEEGKKEAETGEKLGIVKILYGCTFKRGLGDKFYGKEIMNKRLALPRENLKQVVERVAREAKEMKKKK
ncbi:hypothetical protein V500_03956 [Pseudogymnoascus sp. VKM F-4518 (FW-2643)]|nr:hypothetical protein V500_03956 [Pseudogymnoascus sp. VKM F-4518 (FW-2643)]